MRFLRQNTAVRVSVGPFLDKTDGITPETALTVTNCKLTLMVDDGDVPTLVLDTNPTASAGANDMVHVTGDDAGFYDLELAAANVNYVGRAILALTDAANHCPVFHEFTILPARVYDSFVKGTLYSSYPLTSGTAASIANGTITLATGHGLTNANSFFIVLTGGTNAFGKSRIISYSGSGDVFNVDPAWNANGETTPSGTITYEVYATPPAPVSTPIAADVLKWNGTSVPTPDTAGYPKVTIKDGTGTGEIDTASGIVQATLTSAGIQAVWDALTSNLTTVNSIGKRLVDDVDATISSRASGSVLGTPVNASISADIAAVNTKLGTPAGASVSADIATTNSYIDTEVAAILAAVDTEVAAIKAKTDNLPAAPAAVGDVPTANQVRDAIFARAFHAKMSSLTFEEVTALVACAILGKVSGLSAGAPVFRNLADNADAVSASTDGDGNRSAVTLTAGSVHA